MLDDIATLDTVERKKIESPKIEGPKIDGFKGKSSTIDRSVIDHVARDEAKGGPALDLRVQPEDAIFAAAGTREPAGDPPPLVLDAPATARPPTPEATDIVAPAPRSRVRHMARGSAATLAVAGLCALAFAAGAHGGFGTAPAPVATPDLGPAAAARPPSDELAATVRQMAEDLRALKARADQRDAAPPKAPDGTTTDARADARLAQLSTRLDGLESRVTAKLSQIGDQIASLQQPAAPAPRPATVAHARPAEKHAKHVHDAFDPTLDPYAPGAPRPLGAR